jgi:hypothetical protein
MFIFIFMCVQYVLSTKIFTLSLVLPLSLSSLRRYQCLCLHFEPLNGQARFCYDRQKVKVNLRYITKHPRTVNALTRRYIPRLTNRRLSQPTSPSDTLS